MYILSFKLCANQKKSSTYHIPTINRVKSSIMLETLKLDNTENMKPDNNENRSTFNRPHVSAIKPQKCDVRTTPMKPIALIKPCSVVDISMSHLAAGKTNAMFSPSIITPNSENPQANRRKK